MKYLIVSADDLGFSKSINEGVFRALSEGIVTSLNIMPSGKAFEDALNILSALGIKEVGAHLSLTGTFPVSDPSFIPDLVAKDGRFYPARNDFLFKFLSGKAPKEQIYRELDNQLCKLEQSGLKILALNSHEHLHMFPVILDMFIKLSKEHNIPIVRSLNSDVFFPPINIGKMYKYIIMLIIGKRMAGVIDGAGLLRSDNFIGFLDSGHIDKQCLLRMIRSLREGVTELVCHPGFFSPDLLKESRFYENCERELFLLTDKGIKTALSSEGVELMDYKDFASRKKNI